MRIANERSISTTPLIAEYKSPKSSFFEVTQVITGPKNRIRVYVSASRTRMMAFKEAKRRLDKICTEEEQLKVLDKLTVGS